MSGWQSRHKRWWEYADLMGKLRLRPQTVSKLFQQAVQVCPRISGLRQKALVSIVRQHLFQTADAEGEEACKELGRKLAAW